MSIQKIMKALLLTLVLINATTFAQPQKLKLAVAGLTHGHVNWVFNSMNRGDYEIVGITESNKVLVDQLIEKFGFDRSLVFDDLSKMLTVTKPEAVAAFGNTFDHLYVVQIAAPMGIHVMVEKPLAVSVKHAQQIKKLADQHKIHVLTNYETSWYATTHKAIEIVRSGRIGEVRKVVIRDGHRGPKKIGVNPFFLEWLTDPKLNGGGALMDFGCYGANLMTWIMQGQNPLSVSAVTRQLQPENNPNVDDDATILVNYANAEATIQASWNWPIGRKDMEIYGLAGAILVDNANRLRVRIAEGYDGFHEEIIDLPKLEIPHADPFRLLKAVVRKEIVLSPYDLYSLENNLIVVQILEAAKVSADQQRKPKK